MSVPDLNVLEEFQFNLGLTGSNSKPDGISDGLARLLMASLDVTDEPYGMNEMARTPPLERLKYNAEYEMQYNSQSSSCQFYYDGAVYMIPPNAGHSGTLLEQAGFRENNSIALPFLTGLAYLARPRTLLAKMIMSKMHENDDTLRRGIEDVIVSKQSDAPGNLKCLEDLGRGFVDIGGLVYSEQNCFFPIQDPLVNFVNGDARLGLVAQTGLIYSDSFMKRFGIGAFNCCNGFVAFIDLFGRFCIGAATKENLLRLQQGGYHHRDDLPVPLSRKGAPKSWETAILVPNDEGWKNIRWAHLDEGEIPPIVDQIFIENFRADSDLVSAINPIIMAANMQNVIDSQDSPKNLLA